MNKKFKYISYIVLSSMLFTGCYKDTPSDDVNNDRQSTGATIITDENSEAEAEKISEPVKEEYTEFYALGNTYSGNKGYDGYNTNDEIVNSSNYVQNEYKEIDFAIDLVSQHLLGNASVYDFLVSSDENGQIVPLTESDKAQIENDLYSLKVDQYGAYEDTPLYFNFMHAKFLGLDGEGVKLYIRGHISGFAVSYIVTVYEKENNLVAKIV